MNAKNSFSTTILVNNTPQEVFRAVNNVRGWWSEATDGDTDKLGSVFYYHNQNLHRCTFKITEFVANEKVVWHVLDNYFNFIQDKTEWIGTDIVFEIAEKGEQTELRFTHVGLEPAYECYDVCSNAWGRYIAGSLRDLITTGKGQPNPIEEIVSKARQMMAENYTANLIVEQSPEEVFAAVNNVRDWWSGEITGQTDKLGAVFKYHYKDIHRSTQSITEFMPNERVVWHIVESQLNFLEDKGEWNDTEIVFEIARKDGMTELRFTHLGLVPAVECYDQCSNAWDLIIKHSLFDLITKGNGAPNLKLEEAGAQAAV